MNQLEKNQNKERYLEEQHLSQCVQVIDENINEYSEKVKNLSAETKVLYDNYRSNNPELHNDLVLNISYQNQAERTLHKNMQARNKPYFGRIDYHELDENIDYSLYIGKAGILKNNSEIIIIDWRAPISSVYYDSDIGRSSFHSPLGEEIFIDLNLKRTYEIHKSQLIDYYDANVIANDEFLTKYLGKNKEAVLGEIIATIQKEQNEIIRDTPWHSVIVQGVAGSGKTTVAMHRISYILYNYKDKFRSDEFYIIGSNKMLLNYITGVLPNLDVYDINQRTMEEFFLHLLENEFTLKKEKCKIADSFYKNDKEGMTKESIELKEFKGSIYIVRALELYLKRYELKTIPTGNISYKGKSLYTTEEILSNFQMFKESPLQEKIDLFNTRITNKVKLMNELEHEEREVIREELKKYRNYFGKKSMKFSLMEVYKSFIYDLMENPKKYGNLNMDEPSYSAVYEDSVQEDKEEIPSSFLPSKKSLELFMGQLSKKEVDVYDLGLLTLIKKRLLLSDDFTFVSHIIIDEAQDFGVSVYGVLRRLFKTCTYTIMGDVTQNIYYYTGMNDWEGLKEEVFQKDKDKFYILAKSYRNTVEISDYASNVLKKCTFRTYDIEPIIRHGNPVSVIQCSTDETLLKQTVDIITKSKAEGYTTFAVICRTVEEAMATGKSLSKYMEIKTLQEEGMEDMVFTDGVMVLPIHLTKGLEFDCVILMNPDETNYKQTNAEAKLLYVAITRALHELYVLYKDSLSKLLV